MCLDLSLDNDIDLILYTCSSPPSKSPTIPTDPSVKHYLGSRSKKGRVNLEIDQSPRNRMAASNLPSVELSFDTSRGGAWDDKELINAYDAAVDEFHVSSCTETAPSCAIVRV
jgi:hypothetical protein